MAAPAVEGFAITALCSVMLRVRQAAERSGRDPNLIRVVGVSKTKPVSLIREVYSAGHRCSGNHRQSSPASVPNLAMVESVDNEKIANHLDRAVSNIGRKPLKVLVQVNTSGETCESLNEQHSALYICANHPLLWDHARDLSSNGPTRQLGGPPPYTFSINRSKSGVNPSECVELAKHVKFGCPNLKFSGLMTIGMPDYTSTPENFKTLLNCRTAVCKTLGIAEEHCELSMGMSGDYEPAIEMGSTNVRIGSTIFGPRDYSKKQAN